MEESHKEYSEACQKAVERMSEHPYSHEQCLEQVERLRKASALGNAGDVPTVSEKDLSSLEIRIQNKEQRLQEDKTIGRQLNCVKAVSLC